MTATTTARHWEHFPHGSDIGIRGVGPTLEAAFEEAARALTGVICDLDKVRRSTAVQISVDGDDDEFLFLNWIDALVFEMATRRMLFGAFEVRIDGRHLSAECHGEPIDVARHQPAVEVKGATLTELRVAHAPDGWLAQCVVDV